MANKKNQQRADQDIVGAIDDPGNFFKEAIFETAGKFIRRDKIDAARAAGEGIDDTLIWETQNLLSFTDFCESPEHLNFPQLSPRQKRVADYMFGDDPKRIFDTNRTTAVLCWGKGSGKDVLSAMLILYAVYILLNLKNPQHYMGLPDHNDIDLLNVAASKEQAQKVFFQYFKSFVLHWPWLKNKYDISLSGKSFSSSKDNLTGADNRVIITTEAVIFPKSLRAFSGSSEAETLEGSNLLMFVLDECDAFKTRSATRSAKKIYRVLRTSASSRFKRRFKCFMISYPRSKFGFIMKQYGIHRLKLSSYADKAYTWQVKPRHLFSKQTFEFEGIQVPMDLIEEFTDDPMMARAAFLCDPPVAESMYLDDSEKVDMALKVFNTPLFTFRDYIEPDKVTGDLMVRKSIAKSPMLPDRSIRYVLCLDLGHRDNPSSLSLMHREAEKIITDFSTVWIPKPKKQVVNPKDATEVDISNVEDIIREIFNLVTISGVYTDRWQSVMLVQRLRSSGILADHVQLNFEDYEVFKRLLYSGNVQLVKHKRLLDELRSLQLYSGKKVDHPEGGTNDMAVTIVMGVRMLTHIGKGSMSSNMAAEGEYVGDNMHEAHDSVDIRDDQTGMGIIVDGHRFQ